MMTDKVFRVLDCVGREWHVTEAAVREDYIGFLMYDDGFDRAEAERQADSKEGKRAWGIDGYWFAEQIADSPRNVKVQLRTIGGIAIYGRYNGEDFFEYWAPIPRLPKDNQNDD